MPQEERAVSVAVGAVFGPRGLLLIRRAKPPFVGLWGMPGGKVEAGEHLDDAIVRELREEAGISARFEELCGVVTERVLQGRRLQAHYLLLVCRLSTRAVRAAASAEGDVGWFPAVWGSRIRGIIPSDRLMLERLVLAPPRKRFYRCTVAAIAGGFRVRSFR
jgi:ADP-ribose pyrophosphatase YjhB (NUDIX family)